jgi:hypothetical protein
MCAPATPDNRPLNIYTLQTNRLRTAKTPPEISLHEPLGFTKDVPVLKIPQTGQARAVEWGTLLFDLETDPHQDQPLNNPAIEQMMIEHLVRLMKDCDSPDEQFERLGLANDE